MDPNCLFPTTPFTKDFAHGELGITRHTLRQLEKAGVVRRMTSTVYVAGDVEDTVTLRAQAMALVVRPHQVVCDRTAAWLWGIELYTYAELDDPVIETCALRGNDPCRRAGVDGHTRDLRPEDYVTFEGVRVTTPLRTALDLACLLTRMDALAALDAFRQKHGLTLSELMVGSRRFAKRRGVRQLRELVPLSDPRAESVRESWTRLALVDAGLPVPEPQVWIHIEGVPTYRLDLAYRRRRVAIEYDGWEAHERTPEQGAYDAARRQWLRDHGWTVIVVRSGDFTGSALDRWLNEVRNALAAPYSNRRRLERGSRNR